MLGSPVLARHPKNVYLPERAVLEALNEWIGRLFASEHRDETVDLLLASAGVTGAEAGQSDMIKTKVTQASTKLRRLQDAIKAGVNPAAVVDATNEAQAELEAAQAEEALRPEARVITRAEVYAMIDYLGIVGAALKRVGLDSAKDDADAIAGRETSSGGAGAVAGRRPCPSADRGAEWCGVTLRAARQSPAAPSR